VPVEHEAEHAAVAAPPAHAPTEVGHVAPGHEVGPEMPEPVSEAEPVAVVEPTVAEAPVEVEEPVVAAHVPETLLVEEPAASAATPPRETVPPPAPRPVMPPPTGRVLPPRPIVMASVMMS